MIARLLSLGLILLAVFGLTRVMVRALPGDPLDTLLAETGTTLPREMLRQEMGLDQPVLKAVAHDLALAVQGDLGRSLLSKRPVAPQIAQRLGRSFALATTGLILGIGISMLLGVAATQNRLADRLCTFHGALAASLPTPWLGPILIYILAVKLPLFPIGRHLALPALTLAITFSGFWSRLIRERVRETLRLGAAPGARARGIPEWKVLLKYGLAPASPSLLAYLGTQFGALLAGAFVIEVVFEWPGLGSLLVDSVLKRDYPVVQAAVFCGAAVSLLGTALGDALQHWADPRDKSA